MNNTTNIIAEYEEKGRSCPFPNMTLWQQSVRVTSVLMVIVLSLVGNIFVLYVVRNNIKLHTVTHYLIVNLALVDLLITVFNMSVLLKTEVTGNDEAFGGIAGKIYCVGIIVVLNLCVVCSIFTMTAIAVERFCSILFPFKRIITFKLAKVILVGIWLCSFLITIPFFFNTKVVDYYGDGVFYCVEDWSPLDTTRASQVFQIVFFVLIYACPLIAIFMLYLCIGIKLWRRQAKKQVSSFANSHRRTRMTVQVTKMLIVSVTVFAICWLPQHVVLFINYFMLHICPPEFLWFGGTLLAYANSAMNPIIYVAFHSEYRKQFKVAVVKCCPICRGLRNSGVGLNMRVGRKVEGFEEFVMVKVLSFKTKSSEGTEASLVNAFSPCNRSKENAGFNKRE